MMALDAPLQQLHQSRAQRRLAVAHGQLHVRPGPRVTLQRRGEAPAHHDPAVRPPVTSTRR